MKTIVLTLILIFNFNFVFSQHTGLEFMKFIKTKPTTEGELNLYKKG